MTPLEELMDHLEETLLVVGEIAPFDFNGFNEGPDGGRLCRAATAALTSRFPCHLEWRRWPSENLGLAEPQAEFDFFPDSEQDVTIPFTVLVPDHPDAVAEELERQFYPHGRPEKRRWWQRSR